MTLKLIRGLVVWAGFLTFVVLALMPLGFETRVAVTAITLVTIVGAWFIAGHRSPHLQGALSSELSHSLPSSSYRLPVVFVCGGGQSGLFGPQAIEQSVLRLTQRGCYVSVPVVASLPQLIAAVLEARPQWRAQLSLMCVVNPAEHTDSAFLAGQLRELNHQITMVSKRAIALPLWVVTYQQGEPAAPVWFSWENAQSKPVLRQAGACVDVVDWQRQADDVLSESPRLGTIVRLRSTASWLIDSVVPHFIGTARRLAHVPIAFAITFVPRLPQRATGNLWQQWLQANTALTDTQPSPADAADTLPFPDALLELLPRNHGSTAVTRAAIIAVWMFMAAVLVAMLNSGWQNTLLMRQVSDDLRRYTTINAAANGDSSTSEMRQRALLTLRQDAQRLDGYYRHGEPLSLGLGLYRAERLRRMVWDAIGSYQPPQDKPALIAGTVRLDSLSLFTVDSAQLKPGSTRVLINALVNIKAQPGWLIVVAGHTDASGSAEHNLKLSRERAFAVREWMQRMGRIPDSCFAVQGFGASQPIASNDTAQGRSANRRVDIRLVQEEGACGPVIPLTDRQPLPQSAAFKNQEKGVSHGDSRLPVAER